MAVVEVFANTYSTTLNGAITNVATSVLLSAAPPAPLTNSGSQWRLLVDAELMLVTGVSGSTVTVVRGVEGTTASAHGNGAAATHLLTAAALLMALVDPGVCEGRLSLSSALAVPTADATAQGTLYLQPFRGNRLALYSGFAWSYYPLTIGSPPSVALAAASGTVQDIFAYSNNGTVTLVAVSWTNNSTRATALSTQDGIQVLSTDATRRYLGTIYFDSLNGVSDSAAMRGVWNYYNRVPRKLLRTESTTSWTYASTAFRQANANAANQVGVVIGVQDDLVSLECSCMSDGGAGPLVAIGKDSLLDSSDDFILGSFISGATTVHIPFRSMMQDFPAPGYHYYAWLENVAIGTATFYGVNGDGTKGGGIWGLVRA